MLSKTCICPLKHAFNFVELSLKKPCGVFASLVLPDLCRLGISLDRRCFCNEGEKPMRAFNVPFHPFPCLISSYFHPLALFCFILFADFLVSGLCCRPFPIFSFILCTIISPPLCFTNLILHIPHAPFRPRLFSFPNAFHFSFSFLCRCQENRNPLSHNGVQQG